MIVSLGINVAAATLPGKNYRLTPDQIRFTHQSMDGSYTYKCNHVLEDALAQDWIVKCVDQNERPQKTYRVHLWLKLYSRAQQPRMTYELLYWITDITNSSKPDAYSSTLWFHLRDPSALDGLRMGLGVEKDLAGLYLDIMKL